MRAALEEAIEAARGTAHGSVRRVVEYEDGSVKHSIELRVRAERMPDNTDPVFVIVFDEVASRAERPVSAERDQASVEQLVQELDVAHEKLRSTVWHYETAMSELRASNAALQAMNAQLHVMTSEVDAGREELDTMNEELLVLNRELTSKIAELSRANRDLQSLAASPEIAVVFLDEQLAIQRFTPAAQTVFNVRTTDVGRPLADLSHRLDSNDLLDVAAQVIATAQGADREVRSTTGRVFLARISPTRLPDGRIEGVVLAFIDITELRLTEAALARSEAALRITEQRLATALRSAPVALIVHGADLNVTWGYINGKELTGELSSVLARDRVDEYSRIVREVVTSGTRARVELELKIDDHFEPYEFQIEPTAGGRGATAVGISTTRSRSSA
jgi:two-component system CheB/CheR fusion protein